MLAIPCSARTVLECFILKVYAPFGCDSGTGVHECSFKSPTAAWSRARQGIAKG